MYVTALIKWHGTYKLLCNIYFVGQYINESFCVIVILLFWTNVTKEILIQHMLDEGFPDGECFCRLLRIHTNINISLLIQLLHVHSTDSNPLLQYRMFIQNILRILPNVKDLQVFDIGIGFLSLCCGKLFLSYLLSISIRKLNMCFLIVCRWSNIKPLWRPTRPTPEVPGCQNNGDV